MTQQATHAQMGGVTGGADELIPAGAVTFGLEYRTLHGGEEEGVCIHVYGTAIAGDDKELLRFDCFRVAPHYHYRNSTIKRNDRLMLDFTAEGDALAWTIDKIKSRLPIKTLRCEADEIARNIDQKDVDAALWLGPRPRATDGVNRPFGEFPMKEGLQMRAFFHC